MRKTIVRRLLIYLLAVWTAAGCANGATKQPTQLSSANTQAVSSSTALPSETVLPSATSLPSATVQPSATEESNQVVEVTATITPFVISDLDMMPGCTMMSLFPTPEPTEASIFPPVTEDDWVQGPETASVTIIEYSDFQ